MSSDFEIDHISIENTLIGGLYAKTDPDCGLASVRANFIQYNTSIHDNYISNTGNEGLYVGSSFYGGQTVKCNGENLLLLPSLLDGVKIYNNIIKFTDWDGIQVSSAYKNCQIYNNTIQYDSQAEYTNQMSGIMIGDGSKCDCYNNFISHGKGDGIECHGLGGCRIFNNIILEAGRNFTPTDLTQMKHGIFVSELTTTDDSTLIIQNNDIINPKSDGIRFSSVKSKDNQVASNVIINPGNFDYYQNGNTSFKGIDSYIMIQNSLSGVTLRNNYTARSASSVGFLNLTMQSTNDFKLVAGSPLIDRADIDKNINFDFAGTPRPFGPKSDIGAFEFEYDPTLPTPTEPKIQENQFKLIQNPVKEYLIFSLPKESNNDIFLNIFDLNGKMICQFKQVEISAESQTIQVNIAQIAPGIYIYTIRSSEFASSGKFIKR